MATRATTTHESPESPILVKLGLLVLLVVHVVVLLVLLVLLLISCVFDSTMGRLADDVDPARDLMLFSSILAGSKGHGQLGELRRVRLTNKHVVQVATLMR